MRLHLSSHAPTLVSVSTMILVLLLASGCAKQTFAPDDGPAGKVLTAGSPDDGANGQINADGNGHSGHGTAGGDDPANGNVGQNGGGGAGGAGGGGAGGGAGGGGAGGGGATTEVPHAYFVGPDCPAQATECPAEFHLREPVSRTVTFSWHTNDAYCGQPSNQPGAINACENVHYTYSSGTITFQPGETKKVDYIHSLNRTQKVIFNVTMSGCMFGGSALSCRTMFGQ